MTNIICFKGVTITTRLDHDPRCGVYNLCRYVSRIDCIGTHMHHMEYHDDVS